MMGEADRNAFRDDASFLEAFFFGSIVAIVPSSFVLLPAVMEGRISTPGVMWVGVWCFAGGFLSSLTIRVGLHLHGLGFLRLVAASPALPVWALAVLALLTGLEPDHGFLTFVFTLCGISVVGSMAGYRYNDVLRGRLVNSTIWMSIKGPLAGTFVCLLMFVGGVVIEANRTQYLPGAVAGYFLLVNPPLLGGIVAGSVAADTLPYARRPFLLVAATIPAIPLLWAWFLLLDWAGMPPSAEGLGTGHLCAAALALCFLGALLGCLQAWWTRRPPKKSVLYSDPGGLSAEEDGDE